jgi:hypothetical protein
MGTTTRTTLLLLSALLVRSCASRPSPQWLDARALCQQQGKASASAPDASGDYADQCMIARGFKSRWQLSRAGGRRSRIVDAAGPSVSC